MKYRHKVTPTDDRHRKALLAKVIIPDDPDACWGWAACFKETGYGRIRVDWIEYIASRLSYAVHFQDPGDLDVCHSCDNPACCNPRHLYLGTHADNMRDTVTRGRSVTMGAPGRSRNRGETNGQAKITDEQAASLLSMYRTGRYMQRDLASHFGLSRPYVSELVNGKKRKTADVLDFTRVRSVG
jgi:hypothetical protein